MTEPPGWSETPITDLATSERNALAIGPFGSNLKVEHYRSSGVPLVFVRDIRAESFGGEATKFVDEGKARELRPHSTVPGDLLITKMGDPPGDTAIYPAGRPPAIITADCIKLTPDPQVTTAEFLRYAMRAPTFRKAVLGESQGVAQQKLSLARFAALSLSLPPLNEQRRIVAKLDAIFEQTRAAKARLKRLPALLDKLKRSILAAAFRGDLTKDWRSAHPGVEPATTLLERIRAERRRRWEDGLRTKGKDPKKVTYLEPAPVDASGLPELPGGWAWASLDDCCHFVTSGSRGWAEYYSDTGPLFIRVGNLARSGTELRLDDVQRVSPPPGAEGERTRVEVGDVLISITADVGRLGVVEADLGDAYINQHVALSRPAEPSLGKFLAVALLNPLGFQKFIVGAQYGMTKASLSLDQVRSAPIAVPPESEITAVLEAIAVALGSVDAITTKGTGSSDRLGAVEQAALAKAFRGELVPQNPTDEPASVLLNRIRATRAAESELAQRRRGQRRDNVTPETEARAAGNGSPKNGHHDTSLDLVVATFQVDRRLTATAIAEATGLDTSSVMKAIKALVDAGQLRVQGRARSAIYEWNT